MTRINLIPVSELSDQHLMAEYRELPRIINGVLSGKMQPETNKIPKNYVLGVGHVNFFTNKLSFLADRYKKIHTELIFRNFNLNPDFTPTQIFDRIAAKNYKNDEKHQFKPAEVNISRSRIIEKILLKPNWYRWTRRRKPKYA